MRKFKVVVETTKTYEIEVDESKLTEEYLDSWEETFMDLDLCHDRTTSLVSEYCEKRSSQGDTFIEGFGRVIKKDRVYPYKINENEICEYMKIIKADDGGYVDITIRE